MGSKEQVLLRQAAFHMWVSRVSDPFNNVHTYLEACISLEMGMTLSHPQCGLSRWLRNRLLPNTLSAEGDGMERVEITGCSVLMLQRGLKQPEILIQAIALNTLWKVVISRHKFPSSSWYLSRDHPIFWNCPEDVR